MKQKFVLFHPMLAVAVLFSILFQSFHSFEHLAKQLSEKQCNHEHRYKHEITHQHHGDHCFVCDFTFSSFIATESISYRLYAQHTAIPYFFTATETPESFSGSSYAHRGPPVFIV